MSTTPSPRPTTPRPHVTPRQAAAAALAHIAALYRAALTGGPDDYALAGPGDGA